MPNQIPSIPTAGVQIESEPEFTASMSNPPTMGPVQEKETTTKVAAIKNPPINPPRSARLSRAFTRPEGRVSSNIPRKERGKHDKNDEEHQVHDPGGGDLVEQHWPKDQRNDQSNHGIDKNDPSSVNQSFSDTFRLGFTLFGEIGHGEGHHGEYTWGKYSQDTCSKMRSGTELTGL